MGVRAPRNVDGAQRLLRLHAELRCGRCDLKLIAASESHRRAVPGARRCSTTWCTTPTSSPRRPLPGAPYRLRRDVDDLGVGERLRRAVPAGSLRQFLRILGRSTPSRSATAWSTSRAAPGARRPARSFASSSPIPIAGAGPTEVLPQGEIGEVIAPMECLDAFAGYWKRPDSDAKSIRGGWYFTGDLGYFDEDGRAFSRWPGRRHDHLGRREHHHPEEVEDVLDALPLVPPGGGYRHAGRPDGPEGGRLRRARFARGQRGGSRRRPASPASLPGSSARAPMCS